METPALLAAPFLALQLAKWGLPEADKPRHELPPPDAPAWSNPLALLRQTRNREWLRIAARALGGCELTETLHDLSAFADAAIEAARLQARQLLEVRHGIPRGENGAESRLIVLGMGKLGGRELNFSSDIDLICAYTESGETDGAKCISNGEYFVKLVQEMVRLLALPTEDGFVFRVDLMLRPFGSASPVALSAAAMEDYYQAHGREWERYALIKARTVAGDYAEGAALLKRLQPFVFRRYLDFDAINALRDLKARIAADAVTRGLPSDDLKVGVGGIRECEFIVQSFQLVRGGQDARLRSSGWAATLATLTAQGLLGTEESAQLASAYQLLRRVENAVQIWGDEQTHALPESPERRSWLAAALGHADWASLQAALSAERARVASLFASLFAEPAQSHSAPVKAAVAAGMAGSAEACDAALQLAGFGEGAGAVRSAIHALFQSSQLRAASESTSARLNALLPLLLEDAQALQSPTLDASVAFARALSVVGTVLGRATYLTLLRESTQARRNLLALVAASPAISEELARHPVLLDQLLDARTLYTVPTREAFREELLPRMEALPVDDVEQAMNLLRQEVREARLRTAAASALAGLPLVKVSDALTWLAEATIEAALAFTWRAMVQAHGQPHTASGEPASFAAIGYGKLGALEMGFGSDLDLVFIHNAEPPDADTVVPSDTAQVASGRPAPAPTSLRSGTVSRAYSDTKGGIRALPQSTWMSRLAQKILNLITTQTHLGRAYEVDLQLRPNGSSGMPVVSLAGFSTYQKEHAWTWEHQALTRARFVAGDAALGAAFAALRTAVLCAPREPAKLKEEIASMREKMRNHQGRTKPGDWSLKHGPGGLVDVEFLVAHAVLAHAHAHPAVAEWPDVWRQIEALVKAGVMPAEEGQALLEAQRTYRAALHQRTLQGLGGDVPAEEFTQERAQVSAIWARTLGSAGSSPA